MMVGAVASSTQPTEHRDSVFRVQRIEQAGQPTPLRVVLIQSRYHLTSFLPGFHQVRTQEGVQKLLRWAVISLPRV